MDDSVGVEESDDELEQFEDCMDKNPPEQVDDTIEQSMNTVVGFTTPHTMKVKGTVGSQSVTVLIDCGATHNLTDYGKSLRTH